MRSTDDMMQELMQENQIDSYVKKNEADMLDDKSIAQCLTELIEAKSLSKAKVIKNSNVNEIYAYQIFAGKRQPSRDKLLCLCFGMRLSIEEVQKLLKQVGYAELYPRIKRDSIMLFALNKYLTVTQVNDLLYDNSEAVI